MVKLMKVPKAIFRQVEPTPDVQNLMNDFFINTKEHIQNKLERSEDHYFEIKSADFAYSSNEVNSNNRITYLEYEERYIVAGMLETRNAFNNLRFTFFRDLTCLEKTVADKMLEESNKRLEDFYKFK